MLSFLFHFRSGWETGPVDPDSGLQPQTRSAFSRPPACSGKVPHLLQKLGHIVDFVVDDDPGGLERVLLLDLGQPVVADPLGAPLHLVPHQCGEPGLCLDNESVRTEAPHQHRHLPRIPRAGESKWAAMSSQLNPPPTTQPFKINSAFTSCEETGGESAGAQRLKTSKRYMYLLM